MHILLLIAPKKNLNLNIRKNPEICKDAHHFWQINTLSYDYDLSSGNNKNKNTSGLLLY